MKHKGSFKKGNTIGFKPGQSGNAGGRPKTVIAVQALAREYTVESIETLAEIMRDEAVSASVRVAAANSLIIRAWGHAPQTIQFGNLDDLTDAELETEIAEGEARFAALKEGLRRTSKEKSGTGSATTPSGGDGESGLVH